MKRLISRILRAWDRRRQPVPVYITPDQLQLYMMNRDYRWRRSHAPHQ